MLLKDAGRYAAAVVRQYEQFIQQSNVYADNLVVAARTDAWRRAVLERCAAAFRHNAKFIEALRGELLPFVKLQSGRPIDSADAIGYATNFNYARRDWSRDPVAERELEQIHAAFRGLLGAETDAGGRALFLGAGPGRTASELARHFEHAIAVDLSYTMAALFERVMRSGVELYEINRSNALTRQELVRLWTAREENRPGRNLDYWVADATALPLRDRSVDVVFSIYFTDVMPFDRLFKEVDRVLQPGGLFVHFGPLDYHFEQYAACLSAEELRERLGAYGYQIVREATVETTHLGAAGMMSWQTCANWAFVAQTRRGSSK